MKIKRNKVEQKSLSLIVKSRETNVSTHELKALRAVEVGFKSSDISTLLTKIWPNDDSGSIKHLTLSEKIELLYLDSLNSRAKNRGINKIPFKKQAFFEWLEEIYKREQILHASKWERAIYQDLIQEMPSYEDKSLLIDRTRFSQFLLLQKLLFWGELERKLPNARLNRVRSRVFKQALSFALQSIKKLPKESAVLGKGLAEVTVGFEIEYQNKLNRYIQTYLHAVYHLNDPNSLKVDKKMLKRDVKMARKPLVKIFGNDLSFIKFGLFGNNFVGHFNSDFYSDDVYLDKDVAEGAFTGDSEHLGFLINQYEPKVEEVYVLPSLNPLLAYADIQTFASSQIAENQGSLHMRLMGFPFQGANLVATEGLVFALGAGLIPDKKYHSGILMENAVKSFDIDFNSNSNDLEDLRMIGAYVPFHLPINKPSEKSKLMQYPKLEGNKENIEGFELRGLSVFEGKNEFDQFEIAVEFEYFIVQGTIAHTVEIKTLAQKKLAKVFEWFIEQRDQVMKEAGIYVPALNERYLIFEDFVPLEEEVMTNLYTIYLSEVNKKSKSNRKFRAKLKKIALTYLKTAKQVTNLKLKQ